LIAKAIEDETRSLARPGKAISDADKASVRLEAARQRTLMDGRDATTAAYEIGYESISQFSRDYSRIFGQLPMRDVKALEGSNIDEAKIA